MKDSSREPDAALVTRAKEGDRAAFGLLVQRYQHAVCAIAYSRLCDAESARDIAQEAFLISLERLSTLRSASKFGPWLRRITRRLCSRWQRSELYRQAVKRTLSAQVPSREETTPADILEAKENGAILKKAIERLPERLREALVLYYFHGQSQAETAASLGIGEAAVQMRVARAKSHIREQLASEIERELPKAAPDHDFIKRTLAAIPVGSICGKLGLNVARVSAIEAVQQIAYAGAQKASTIITGGGTIMTTKQAVAGGIGALLLAASVGTNVVLVLRGESGPEQAEAPAVAADDLAIAKAEAEKDELSGKVIDLEKEVERQKKRADAAWKSRQALANELATLEGKLDEELARLGRPERQDDRERGEREPRRWVITRSTALTRLDKVSGTLDKYFKERETFPASLTELVGLYLDDESRIIDPSTEDVFEYESGVNASGGQYYEIKTAEGTTMSETVSPEGIHTKRIGAGAPPGEDPASSSITIPVLQNVATPSPVPDASQTAN